MSKLNPTLWRTCRVLANTKRLELLYALFAKNHQSVQELASATAISPEHASVHLRLLNSRGLIRQARRDMRLINSTEANETVKPAPLLLEALRQSHTCRIPIDHLYKQATAFTHARRIEIMQKMPPAGTTKDLLHAQTTISFSALTRHLNKLASRGFVTVARNFYRPVHPSDPLSKALLNTICSGPLL